ncbi:hypothetical protein N9B24_00330 [bacterium]|nr:hypothetical protein [bacterium]
MRACIQFGEYRRVESKWGIASADERIREEANHGKLDLIALLRIDSAPLVGELNWVAVTIEKDSC